jgi:hypothetical protein
MMDYGFIKPRLAPGNFDSMFAFSVHKCGSSLMNRMIRQVCEKEDIPDLNIPGPLFTKGVDPSWKTDADLLQLIKPGYIYHSFRDFPPVLAEVMKNNAYKCVFLVRDPRDALVSQYFSFMPGGSHIIPNENPEHFLKVQEKSKGLTIDQYVVTHSKNLKNKLEAYKQNLDFSVTKVFKYEDIFFDKYRFISEIFTHFDMSPKDDVLRSVAADNDIIPEKENPNRHIRKGVPGDHKVKLQPQTIEELDKVFEDIGSFFGYDIKSQKA